MDNVQISDSGHLFYDPYIYGYDDNFFKTISGSITVTNGKIRVNSGTDSLGRVNSIDMFMFGELTYGVTIPTAPTAGDNRVWGFFSRAIQNRNAAYFYISGTNFYARSYGDTSSTSESTTIEWDSAWTATPIDYKIVWRIERVDFYVNNIKLATHTTKVPAQMLMPMYFSNGANDNMDINFIRIRDARKVSHGKAIFWVSTSSSPSPSISPSLSPSLSPSISPSVSPSASLSPSISPSVSPSASLSPSISPSESPSTSLSPSISPSLSPSLSPSISPSISPSVSPSF